LETVVTIDKVAAIGLLETNFLNHCPDLNGWVTECTVVLYFSLIDATLFKIYDGMLLLMNCLGLRCGEILYYVVADVLCSISGVRRQIFMTRSPFTLMR